MRTYYLSKLLTASIFLFSKCERWFSLEHREQLEKVHSFFVPPATLSWAIPFLFLQRHPHIHAPLPTHTHFAVPLYIFSSHCSILTDALSPLLFSSSFSLSGQLFSFRFLSIHPKWQRLFPKTLTLKDSLGGLSSKFSSLELWRTQCNSFSISARGQLLAQYLLNSSPNFHSASHKSYNKLHDTTYFKMAPKYICLVTFFWEMDPFVWALIYVLIVIHSFTHSFSR